MSDTGRIDKFNMFKIPEGVTVRFLDTEMNHKLFQDNHNTHVIKDLPWPPQTPGESKDTVGLSTGEFMVAGGRVGTGKSRVLDSLRRSEALFLKAIDDTKPKVITHNISQVTGHLDPGTPRFFQAIKNSAEDFYVDEVEDLNGQITEYESFPIRMKHNHPPEEESTQCSACTLQKKADAGHPVMRHHLNVVRDVFPEVLVSVPVEAPKHKKRRNQSLSYHLRVQKKWNKRVVGQTCLKPLQETVILSVGSLALKTIRDLL